MPKILVLDSSDQRRTELLALLIAADFRVCQAATEREALLKVAHSSVDIIVTEREVTDGDAVDLLHELQREGRDLPLILYTLVPGDAADEDFDSIVSRDSGFLALQGAIAAITNRERLASEF